MIILYTSSFFFFVFFCSGLQLSAERVLPLFWSLAHWRIYLISDHRIGAKIISNPPVDGCVRIQLQYVM